VAKRLLTAAALLVLFGACLFAQADGTAVILDTTSFWRVHYTIRPPVVRDGDGVRSLKTLTGDTPAPPESWTQVDFDDRDWTRTPADLFPVRTRVWAIDQEALEASGITAHNNSSPALAMIFLRGKFGVTDPGAVRGLKLSLAYHGGVVVCVNGKEVGRADMGDAGTGVEALAKDYPRSAFLRTDGSPVMSEFSIKQDRDAEAIPAWKSRLRGTEIPIPANVLRKGTNVLAVAVHRAAYLPEVRQWIVTKGVMDHEIPWFLWATCGLNSVRLDAPSQAGLTSNVGRPTGWQAWTSPPMQQDFDLDYGDRFESRRVGMRVVGSRGGVFSGKVVVGRDAPIRALKADISDLVCRKTGAKVPASAVKVRYALPDGSEPAGESHYPVRPALFDGLSDTPPATVEVGEAKGSWPVGAVCPVWVTVAVPVDAVPGDYTGTLTIAAADLAKPFEVPVELKVCAWRVPEPKDFRTVVDLIQSPETVAMWYDVPLYGEKHFQLLEKSLERLGYVGNWTVHIPLICQTNLGNAESMVRWVRKPDGSFRYDFSPVDRYLELAEKHMGKPRVVILQVWDFFLGTAGATMVHPEIQKIIPGVEDIPVSMLDEKTGKVSTITVGRYDAKGKDRWRALVTELLAHLRKRGMDKSVVLGLSNDVYPTREIVEFWKDLLPGVAWGRYSHFERASIGDGWAPVVLQAYAYQPTWGIEPMYGWKRPDRVLVFFRTGFSRNSTRNTLPWDLARLLGEITIQGPWRGFGRVGLDFWPALRNRRGVPVGCIQARYPRSSWRQLDGMLYVLAPPGPEGALAAGKLEMMREGLQETEARIFLEDVLTDPARRGRLPAALVAKARTVLNARMRALAVVLEKQEMAGFQREAKPYLDGYGAGDFQSPTAGIFRQWYTESGWQQRSEDLYTVADEVNATLATTQR